MGYHPRIEVSNMTTFQTTRCKNSELWFVNNRRLEESMLAYTAKYCERYKVCIYAFAIEGNHTQFPAIFAGCNRAHFMRDLNSSIARAVPRYVKNFEGGRVWGRRYSSEFVPGDEDIENQFFYTALQPIQDGHVSKLSQYPFYNCFHDAVYGISRRYKMVDWAAYNERRRWSKEINIKDFTRIYTLEFKRLPGYEGLTQKQYATLMYKKLEIRRLAILEKRRAEGKPPCGDGSHLRLVKPGSRPKETKTSNKQSHRPRVLSVCNERRAKCKEWYFEIYFSYRVSSKRYRMGSLGVKFPKGTYKPPKFTTRGFAPEYLLVA